MNGILFSRLSLVFCLFLMSSAVVAETPDSPPAVGSKDRCAVCGMFVAKYANWVSSVVLNDGRTLFFDGPKDMFRFLAEPGVYAKGRAPSDIQRVYVTEYYSARLTRAEGLFYVVGSDLLGPMGPEFVPVDGKDKAETFRVDHKGKYILSFKDITADELKKLEY